MVQLSQYRGEEAIDKLADLLEPASEIMTDKDLVAKIREKNKLGAIKIGLKNHKKAVIQVLAIMTDNDPDTYSPNMFELPMIMLQLLNDPDIVSLFTLQGQNGDVKLSGSATGSTGEEKV